MLHIFSSVIGHLYMKMALQILCPVFKLGFLPAWILALSLLNRLTFNYVRICKYFHSVQSRNIRFKMFFGFRTPNRVLFFALFQS